jgi:hypothetical protein
MKFLVQVLLYNFGLCHTCISVVHALPQLVEAKLQFHAD